MSGLITSKKYFSSDVKEAAINVVKANWLTCSGLLTLHV